MRDNLCFIRHPMAHRLCVCLCACVAYCPNDCNAQLFHIATSAYFISRSPPSCCDFSILALFVIILCLVLQKKNTTVFQCTHTHTHTHTHTIIIIIIIIIITTVHIPPQSCRWRGRWLVISRCSLREILCTNLTVSCFPPCYSWLLHWNSVSL